MNRKVQPNSLLFPAGQALNMVILVLRILLHRAGPPTPPEPHGKMPTCKLHGMNAPNFLPDQHAAGKSRLCSLHNCRISNAMVT